MEPAGQSGCFGRGVWKETGRGEINSFVSSAVMLSGCVFTMRPFGVGMRETEGCVVDGERSVCGDESVRASGVAEEEDEGEPVDAD